MTTTQIVILVLVLLVVAAVAAAMVAQSRKRARLQSTFGPEYDRTVESSGRRREAERELAEREQRRRQLDIRPLPAEERREFSERWRAAQADFVDQPEVAVRQADTLVEEVMSRRGYPVGDFEQMSRDVSVDHANVVQEYRAAHDISELNDRKAATTEQLRQAMVHYRALFTDLLSDSDDSSHDEDRTGDTRTSAGTAGAMAGRTSPDRTADEDDRPRDDRTGLHGSDDDRIGAHRREGDWTDDGAPARPATYGSDRSDDVAHGSTADHEHTRSADADRTADDRETADRAAPDDVRTERQSSDRIDTSRADGVRAESGGLHRRDVEDRDHPRT